MIEIAIIANGYLVKVPFASELHDTMKKVMEMIPQTMEGGEDPQLAKIMARCGTVLSFP
jgi:hypothetical protein